MSTDNKYPWIDFYTEFADKLLQFKDNRKQLVEMIKKIYTSTSINLPKLEKDGEPFDIDPFTVYCLFNKSSLATENRIKLMSAFSESLDIKASVPNTFDGIPLIMNLNATFYAFVDNNRGEDDINNLWNLFAAALALADSYSDENKAEFIKYYDLCLNQKGVRWNITIGLFWIRPYTYINLDSTNKAFILNPNKTSQDFIDKLPALNNVPLGEEYLKLCDDISELFATDTCRYNSLPELSTIAWETANHSDPLVDNNNSPRYWMYTVFDNISWAECQEKSIMVIGADRIGDFTDYEKKEDIRQALIKQYGGDSSRKNQALMAWNFSRVMKVNDVIIAKRANTLVGKGIVRGEYTFDDERSEYKNVIDVEWIDIGEWEHPGLAVRKRLTDITQYSNYIEQLMEIFSNGDIDYDEDSPEIVYPEYSADDFLNEVYMDEGEYLSIVAVLEKKKNIILQGAPGVGKTFAAKRLAYSIMGMQDSERATMIQFHQSYSYEDFIMGFRPTGTGFELKKGVFYNFCKKAELDSDNDYFFIIDEINRGNLSKIFGELFMLLESDKRGIELQLLYSDEKFSIPDNVYIIGMMNTADRSLAMLDYALRRRFAFIDLKPGFKNKRFLSYRTELNNDKFDRLIATIEILNDAIASDSSLGEGFCIGHSYFCNLNTNEIDYSTLNSIVEYELIPLLKEYWFDEPSKVDTWSNKLRSAIK